MDLAFCSFASGSSGNSYLIKSEETTLLVDVGISGKRIAEGMAGVGLDVADIDAILITHEHSDHVHSLGVMQKKAPDALIWSNLGTFECVADKIEEGRHRAFNTGESFTIGDIEVLPFRLSHDAAEPVGYRFRKNDKSLAIVTDTGYVSEEIYEAVRDCDLLVLEANHDENVLMVCRYPYHVKRRILSDKGHLCNEAAAAVMSRIIKERFGEADRKLIGAEENPGTGTAEAEQKAEGVKAPLRDVRLPVFLLAHLSKENNTPDMALITVRNALEEEKLFEGRGSFDDLTLEVLRRDRPGRIFVL